MIKNVLAYLDDKISFDTAQAHCDVPCGIYDPITAQIAALTVVRMVDIIEGLDSEGGDKDKSNRNTIVRAILVKEEHAEKVKHEVRVIWGDYIKSAHMETYPELNDVVHTIMQLGSKNRQTVDREASVKLVEEVNKFADIFWKTKGKDTKRAVAPYAPSLELVYPVL
jgi:nickel superoxide dismutase